MTASPNTPPHAHCDGSSTSTLNSLDDTLLKLGALAIPTTKVEERDLKSALGCVLAQHISSQINVPPSNNSAVDGYALNIEDFESDKLFPVSQRVTAGSVPDRLIPGTAARIFTGAPIPDGANTVIMQEDATSNDSAEAVQFSCEVKLGQNIRPLGQDIRTGDTVLRKGDVLNPQRLGLIASVGIARVQVFTPVKVAILSTGDELIEPGNDLSGGQIYNSNRYMLHAMLDSLGFEIVDLGVIEDQLASTKQAISQASKLADVVITTGGASVGEEDHIQTAIKELGEIEFWKVAIKPGKPFMYGQVNSTPILGLPGNPGAVFVTFCVMARHFLLLKQGCSKTSLITHQYPIDFDINKKGIRREFLRVQLVDGKLVQYPNQSSGMLSSASWANGFAIIPEHSTPKTGEGVEFIPFASLFTLFN